MKLEISSLIQPKKELNLQKPKERSYIKKFNKKCNICKKELKVNQTQIDHIQPLSSGGNNDDDNLQILRKECHFTKTKEEQENHQYVKISETKSSYNDQVLDIINSSSYLTRSFVEVLKDRKPKGTDHIYKIDNVRSRKNAVYNNKYDSPVFTVMDEVKPFDFSMSIDAGI